MSPNASMSEAVTVPKDAWEEIEDVVQQIARHSRAAVDPAQFFGELLEGSVRTSAAIGGAVWLKRGSEWALEHQINLVQTGLVTGPTADESPEMGDRYLRHLQLIGQAGQQKQPRAISPRAAAGSSDNGAALNPTDWLLLLCPIGVDGEVTGLLEIFQRPNVSPSACQGFLQFLASLSELASDFLRNHRLRELQGRAELWGRFEEFTEQLHDSLNLKRICFIIANEGRKLIDCDRISVALTRGSQPRMIAITGLETIDRRSNTVRAAQELMRQVTITQRPLWFDDSMAVSASDGHLPPTLDRALHSYLDETTARVVGVVPLIPSTLQRDATARSQSATERRPLGALMIERFAATGELQQLQHRCDVVARQGAAALANAAEYSNLPFLGLLRLLGKLGWHLRLRQLPRTVVIVGLIVAAVSALTLIPADFTIEGRGELQPAVRRGVFAAQDGVVTRLSDKLVGTEPVPVLKDEVLVELTNSALDFELTRVIGELQTARQKLATTNIERLTIDRADRNSQSKLEQLAAEEKELEESIRSLDAQLGVLRRQQSQLSLRSPISGQVLTWDAGQLLQNRPVRQGDRLLEVAETQGDWVLEIRVADQNIGYVHETRREQPELDVFFVLATDPDVVYHGRLESVAPDTREHSDVGPSVLVTVRVPHDAIPKPQLRPGATVIPHIHCGRRSIGFVWFHELIHTVRTRVLF